MQSSYAHPPGASASYGSIGDGTADETATLTETIACNDSLTISPGSTYAVTTIRSPGGPSFFVDFNGASLRGISKRRLDRIGSLETDGSAFLAYHVDIGFNQTYTCGTWRYNAGAAALRRTCRIGFQGGVKLYPMGAAYVRHQRAMCRGAADRRSQG